MGMSLPASFKVNRLKAQAITLSLTLCAPVAAWADAVDDTHNLVKAQLTKAQGIMFLLAVACSMSVAYAFFFSNSDNQHAWKKAKNFGLGSIFLFGGVGFIQIIKKSYAAQAF